MLKSFFMITVLFFNVINTNYINTYSGELKKQELYSVSAVIIDAASGRVLYGKEENSPRAMASTTKIMTLVVALENGNLDDIVDISEYASRMPKVKLGVKENEQYKLRDLLYSLILESHNDVAVAIAEHIGGNVEEYAKLMNEKAKEIGLNDTYFITPNGLDAVEGKNKHHTTAYELALIMRYCIYESPKKEEFIKICQTKEYSFNDIDNNRSFHVFNRNSFFNMYDGVIAGKTGFTNDAGYCYVCAVNHNDETYIVALLGAGWPGNKSYKWKDSKKLLDYAFSNYEYKNIIRKNDKFDYIEVENGIGDNLIRISIDEDISALICDTDCINIYKKYNTRVFAPIKKGEKLGNIEIDINGKLFKKIDIYATKSIYKKDFEYYFKKIILCYIFRKQ